ncbi:MAG: helix-turn-helix transcriptional regulator [Gammaproteobacteria bacterium]|nr:helix-turn-helix transcriptional regulator [Gammaproteobacteria bacterium]
MTDLPKQLQSARKARGLSQHALGKELRLPQSHLSKIEAGKTDLRTSSLQAHARALGLELMLVPRHYVPAIKAIIAGQPTNKSPWTLDEDADDD